ncbi:DNA polymerase beta subunit [Cryptococcus neoformans AD2-60a]|uniref:DNA polymerase n=1 Tax=Cryptococcus neoformans Tu259-1 TaxID=1230072 RepID=A0A854QH86_CRYNE|nr:DNA polymerase beta subunit [Cryptococcus neoformans var. grubii AD2-60a]OWZ57136.1 DNA polymerase beta subunit [Cryptococcus neoformans var. grubii AD1-83a]OWZ58270.1 DNA polymerase beta subunit [Cryptococcus neoformans var. grubii 125.91]OXC87266.1 DNA polymerase beta subunit [Cryptococcus neoformans var. grubii AD1-7a]OXG28782.1 DNA polymerase beta subunit [Cryptococcus neoformans var. grubii Tu259-1]OXG40702.1 DNA polymerase beta subunit [Cryptococcus neoformans var. grubii Bt15]OXG453
MLSSRTPRIVDVLENLNDLKRQHGPKYDELTVPTKALLNGLRDFQSLDQLIQDHRVHIDYRDALRAIYSLAPNGEFSEPCLKLRDLEKVIPPYSNAVVWFMIYDLVTKKVIPRLEVLDNRWNAMVKFNRIHGIGKIRARAFAEEGIETLSDLMIAEGGRFTVSDAQKLAIQYHEEMDVMIPRAEVEQFDRIIKDALRREDPKLDFAIMGSYRRGESLSSDIDVVVWHESYTKKEKEGKRARKADPNSLMSKVVAALVSANVISPAKIFSQGESKVLALTQLPKANSLHRQIDIRLCPIESLPYMLLGNTGDGRLMKIMRWRAIQRGWVLNEYVMGERDGKSGE